ncbi:hypothetical protein KEJ37_07640 [Candidatus Bathyarchaeota archaeon]|nr:hypothetical protein [Candidatus Bathyarchaeota archaeon]
MAKAKVVQKINNNILIASEAISSNIPNSSQIKMRVEKFKSQFPYAK